MKNDDKNQSPMPVEFPQGDNESSFSTITNVIEKGVFPSKPNTPCSKEQCKNISEIIACEIDSSLAKG